MKKLMLFGLGVVASLSVLTSCKKEELAAPTVSFQNAKTSYAATSATDTVFETTITVDAPAKIETIKIYKVSDSGKSSEKIISSDFTSSTQHIFQYKFRAGKYEIEATDKENQTTSAYFTFTGYTSTAGEIVSYSTKIMGAQFNNGLGSFLSTSNGTVYSAANAKLNSSLIDFVYCYRGVTSNVTYKAIIGAPSDADVKIGHANTTGFSSWSNYNNTLFGYSSLTSSEFDAIVDDSEFNSIPTLNETHVFDLAEGDIVAFKTQAGKYGYFRVKSINVGVQGGDAIQKYQDGSIEIDVKVQK
jgi:hypothetical protein